MEKVSRFVSRNARKPTSIIIVLELSRCIYFEYNRKKQTDKFKVNNRVPETSTEESSLSVSAQLLCYPGSNIHLHRALLLADIQHTTASSPIAKNTCVKRNKTKGRYGGN